ncbi:MAG: hypothetical protein EOM23_03700 [Candidatus Moranbacteria bacterium]|nr:hypothetical protein [Candidatus Moranbacteria bacterium]
MRLELFEICSGNTFLKILLISIFFIVGCNSGFSENKNVLILHSYHRGLKYTDDVSAGIDEIFKDKEISLYIQYMDTKRNPSREFLGILKDYYSKKYADMMFDGIIAVDDNALRFMKEYGESIFKYDYMVFCGINDLENYNLGLYIGNFPGPFKKIEDVQRPLSCEWMDDSTLFYTFLEKGGTGLASYNIYTHETTYFLSPSPDFYINNISCYNQRLIMSIAYNGNSDLYELDVQSNQLSVLFQTPVNEIDVFLCSEGILYACDQDGQFDIYQFNETNSTRRKLTDSHFGAFKPVFFEGQYYFRTYSGKGFDFNRLIHPAEVEQTFQAHKINHYDLVLKENLAVNNVLKDWKTEYTPFPIPRFGVPALFLLNNRLIGVAGFAGWDDLKEWIWYGYLGSLGELYAWDYSLIHRGFPDFQMTWNGNESYEELKASFHFPFMLRNDEKNAYIEPAINMGINHTSDDLSWKLITDVYLHQAYQPIVYPDNPISVPQFLQVIQLGTSGFFSQTGIGLALPASMIGMVSQRTAYSKTALQAEAWYPMNFISSMGTSEGKFKISSPIAHFGLNVDLSKEMPFTGIIGIWYDVGIQYWLDFRFSVDLFIGDQIIPKIGIQNTLLGAI